MSVTTGQAYKAAGLPGPDVFWSLIRRRPRLKKYLIRWQRDGCLWNPDLIDAVAAAWREQRGRHPWRKAKTSIRSQIRNLPRLSDQQRAAVERKLKGLEAAWLAARADETRAGLMKEIRLQRRILRADDRKRAP